MGEHRILEDKVCLITGASRGIGQKTAERFVEEGGIVYANARSKGCLEEWAGQITARTTGQIIPVYFDMTKSEEIKQAVMRIKKEQGRVDVLVNNAGMVTNEVLGTISIDKMREMFEVNVFGLTELTQLIATRFMMKQKSGSIVNIASVVGVEGSRGQAAYSASKGAVIALTKSMSKELAPHNVRVNAVAPGMIATDRIKTTIKDVYKDRIPSIGMGRLGTPEEIADACLYFASEQSSYTTGQILVIGGNISP
ncbi:MAG: SDR family oxidoreductase [Lachnospiraceae bacterium]|nr:SDR family oxidoreductase [Lachnospiraceae bacterium]